MFNAKLYAVAFNYMNNGEDAKEVVQRSWIEIFKSLKNYKEQDAIEGWMKTIVIRQAWKEQKMRSKIVDINSVHINKSDDSELRLMENLSCQEILNEMNAIPSGSRMVFKMFVIDELSHQEIADKLSIKASTSRAHLAQARKIMKERFYSINKMVNNGI